LISSKDLVVNPVVIMVILAVHMVSR
jgi:hypothetical protein